MIHKNNTFLVSLLIFVCFCMTIVKCGELKKYLEPAPELGNTRGWPSLGLWKGQLTLLAGKHSSGFATDVWSIDLTSPIARWQQVSTNGTRRTHHCTVQIKDQLYIFGGVSSYSPFETSTSVVQFDLVTYKWKFVGPAKAPMSTPLEPACFSFGNNLVVFGGWSNMKAKNCSNSLFLFNVLSETWTELTTVSGDIPSPRFSASASYDPATNSVYLYGGKCPYHSPVDDDVYKLSVSKWTWERIRSTTSPKLNFTTQEERKRVVVEDLVAQNQQKDNKPANVNNAGNQEDDDDDGEYDYDDDGDEPEEEEEDLVPPGRYSHASVMGNDGNMYIFGGVDRWTLNSLSDLWTFNTKKSQWKRLSLDNWDNDMAWPTPRYSHEAVWQSNRMIVFGGLGHEATTDIWQYVFPEICAAHSNNCEECNVREGCGFCHSNGRCIAGDTQSPYTPDQCFVEDYAQTVTCVPDRPFPGWLLGLIIFVPTAIVVLLLGEITRRVCIRARLRADAMAAANQSERYMYQLVE